MTGTPPVRLLPVALAAVVVLAGCSFGAGPSPTATSGVPTTTVESPPESPPTATTTPTPPTTTRTATPTATPRPDPDAGSELVVVENGDLPVNASRIFHRVEELLDANAEPPVVRIDPDDVVRGYRGGSEFERRMGLVPPTEFSPWGNISGGASADTVLLLFNGVDVSDVPERDLEIVLVHEFVHVVQEQRGRQVGTVPIANGTSPQVRTSLVEGGAVYVTDVYARRYDLTLSDGRLPIAHRANDYRTRPAWALWGTGLYYLNLGAKAPSSTSERSERVGRGYSAAQCSNTFDTRPTGPRNRN